MERSQTHARRRARAVLLAVAALLYAGGAAHARSGTAETVAARNADLVVGYVKDVSHGRRSGPPALQVVRPEPARPGRQAGSDGAFVPSGVKGVLTLRASRDLCERVLPRLVGLGDLALNGVVAGPGAACRDDEGLPGEARNVINVRIR